MKRLKILNTFKLQEKVTLGEARTQAIILERIEKIKELVDAYNFNEEPLTLRLFGDLRSGLGFALECENKSTQQSLTKTLKMYLNNCSD